MGCALTEEAEGENVCPEGRSTKKHATQLNSKFIVEGKIATQHTFTVKAEDKLPILCLHLQHLLEASEFGLVLSRRWIERYRDVLW